uniref:Uncharacterized protein n=1 Tax=Arundo donax TaxID=35708 RepID=A0A0A9DXS0_ARUDO
MASGSSTTLELIIAALVCALLLATVSSGAQPPSATDEEEDRVHDFLRVLDRAATYRRECFGECAKSCYCADNPYSCLRECMPTPPTRRCGVTYDVVQGVFSSSASFPSRPETGNDAGSDEGLFSRAT